LKSWPSAFINLLPHTQIQSESLLHLAAITFIYLFYSDKILFVFRW
jgi:hypothetical protein